VSSASIDLGMAVQLGEVKSQEGQSKTSVVPLFETVSVRAGDPI
jgi:hypothetical protein